METEQQQNKFITKEFKMTLANHAYRKLTLCTDDDSFVSILNMKITGNYKIKTGHKLIFIQPITSFIAKLNKSRADHNKKKLRSAKKISDYNFCL